MSIQPPQGILTIPNATLRVGRLQVDEVKGFDTVLNTFDKNTILEEDSEEYDVDKKWGLKMPNIFVTTFEIKGDGSSFNFRNTSNGDATTGYTLTFSGTTLTLKYGEILSGVVVVHELTTATIPNLDSVYRKVYVTFEKQHFTVTVDGTLVLTYKDATTRTPPEGEYANFFAGTGSLGFKNLKVVAGHFISDGTSNVSLFGGLTVTSNLEVGSSNLFVDTQTSRVGLGTNTPKEALDVVGNMHLTRVSNVSQIKVDSNVVTEYTGPHDRPLRKYPEVALTANSDKGYVVTRSSIYGGGWEGYKAFNEQRGTNLDWLSAGNYVDGVYDKTNGDTGYAYLQDTSGVKYEGEWITLRIPKTIRLKKFSLVDRDGADFTYRLPKDGALLGSNDGTNWEIVLRWTNRTFYTDVENFFYVNTDKYYSHFGLVGEALANVVGAISWDMGEIKYYGYEEGSASLDTTLKSVYNVPATTGTQLEVYYDGRETSSYSGSGTTVTDISPNTNNGTLNGGVGFDSTYKAFTFDGTDDYIEGAVTAETGAWSHTVAFWIKIDQIPSSNMIVYQIKDSSLADNVDAADNTSPQLVIRSDGTLNNAFVGNAGNFLDDNGNRLVAQTGVWQHYVVQYDASNGGTNYRDRKIIINGNKEYYPEGGTATALSMVASNKLFIGCSANASNSGPGSFLDGSIANFRIYNKILNADQVKELYDYQKDYFLGSKSQVTLYKGHLGVGVTEPSGQLELAGDERIQEYPPRGMTNPSTYIEGHGVFKASATSHGGSIGTSKYHPWKAFNKDRTDANNGDNSWLNGPQISGGDYNTSTGVYEGTEKHHGGAPIGAALQLSMPYEIYLKGYSLAPWNYATGTDFQYADSPSDFIIYGSKDNVNWVQIDSRTGQGMSSQTDIKRFSLDTQDSYSHFAIVVTKNNTAAYPSTDASFLAIEEWRLFGTPGPTTLDKGSLSLGRSLDVPRISRYDVDTETPRPEKLVVDFDTTVNSSPTDISGQGNHGAFYNGAYYSAADKAFVFDGTDDYIRTSGLGFSGDQVHSVSLWFWSDKTQSSMGTNEHGLYSTGSGTGTSVIGGRGGLSCYSPSTPNSFRYWRSGEGGKNFGNSTFEQFTWTHCVLVYPGGGPSNARLFLNGVEQLGVMDSGSDGNYSFIASDELIIGDWLLQDGTPQGQYPWDGKMSNFKIYSVALEPSEVKKLYNLDRTGRSMVISDTAVGIGKVPEAQLDVRGSGGFTGSLVTGGSSYVGGLPSSSFVDYLNPSLHVNSLPKNMLRLQVKNVGEIPSLDDFPNISTKSIISVGAPPSLLDENVENNSYDITKDPYDRSCIVFRCSGTGPYLCGGWARLNVRASYRRSYMSVVFVKRSGTATSGTNFYHGCSRYNTADFSGTKDSNPYFQYIPYNSLPEDVWCVSIGFVHFKGATSDYNTGKAGMYRLDTMVKIDTGTEYTFYDEYDEQAQRTFFYNNSTSGVYLDFWNPGWFDTQTMFPENDILNVFTNNLTETSDDRLKSDERFIRKALDSIMKLKPQLYKKHLGLDSVDETVQEESGLMAQDIYYNTPELRHVVKPGDDYGAINSIVPVQSIDPNKDPDYSEWGKNPAKVDYRGLIPYTIKAIQEINIGMNRLKFRMSGIPYSKLKEYTGLCVRSTTRGEVELTTFSNDKSVVGVISTTQNIQESEDSEVLVDITGKGGLWVINTNNIQNGDYLTTSNLIAGYAQVQTDDLVHSYTVAKALQDIDYEIVERKPIRVIKQKLDNVSVWIKNTQRKIDKRVYDKLDDDVRHMSTTILPMGEEESTEISYYEIIRDESRVQIPGYELEVRQELVNVLDEHGQMIWEDHPTETEKAYKIRYLDADGNITDEANHVYKAAFVGCTYHCG